MTFLFRTFIISAVCVVVEVDALAATGVANSDILAVVNPDVLNDADKFGLGSFKLPGPFFF